MGGMAVNAWWNDYIGVPFRDGGCGRSGADCWGLVRLVYRERFGIALPGPVVDVSALERAAIEPALDLTREAFWEAADDPRPGDVVSLRIGGAESHVGLVATPGRMLHVLEGGHAVIETYTSRRWKERVCGVYRYAGERLTAGRGVAEGIRVIGRPSPLKPRVDCVVAGGQPLAAIIGEQCDAMRIPARMRGRGHAYLNMRYVPYEAWGTTFPRPGDVVTFAVLPGKGGKAILGMVAIVAAAALTWWAGGSGGAAVAGLLGVSSSVGSGLLFAASLGLSMLGSALLATSAKMPGLDMGGAGSKVNFLSGSQNSLRTFQVIPQVLGIGRMTLDYLGKPYTERATEKLNYLRAAYTAGYGPVEISDIRNGDTPLGKYQHMEFNVYRGDGGDQSPKLYTRDADEKQLGITLKRGARNTFQTGDDVDQAQLMFYWPSGLWGRSSAGKKMDTTTTFQVRYRLLPNGNFTEAHKRVNAATFTLEPCSPAIDASLVYDEDGNLDPEDWWLATYGVPKKLRAETVEIELYRWYTFSLDRTCRIVKRAGTATDRKAGEPTERLLALMRRNKWRWDDISYVGRLAPIGENEELLAYVCVKGDAIVEVQDRRDTVSVEGCAPSGSGLSVAFTPGTRLSAGAETFSLTRNNTRSAFTRQLTFNLPRGQYEFEVRLTSSDDDDAAGWKSTRGLTCIWQGVRTYTWGRPFNPRKPLAWLELRVQATDQLNGTMDDVNATVKSVVPDYDHRTKTWVARVSNNPASLFRHVLQGPAMPQAHRVPDARLDIAKLERWHSYCRAQGFTYFKVVGGDSAMSVYDLLTEICAAGRAKPILSDGLWSVLIDEPRTEVVDSFSEHNAWSFEWSKTLPNVPHAVRATFVNKEKGFEQDTLTVYADGYGAANATRYENWGKEYFEGITEPGNVQRAVRWALAWAVLRGERLSFMASMEHLIVTYGDLVRVTNSFVKWGLGSGWVAGLVRDGGKLAGVRLSETVTLTAGQEYSIRFRLASRRGQTLKADIAPVAESVETDTVRFAVPLSGVLPAVDDLYQFGYRDRESHECLVESIVPEAGGTAKITVCDYSPEIYDVDDGAIPAYDSDISEPQLLPSVVIASVPLGNVYSDERALAWDNGSLRPRIGVGWKNPDGLERQVEYVQFRIIHLGADDDEPRLSDSVPIGSGDVYFDNVAEGDVYKVQGRYLTGLGVTGQWATLDASHKVIGRTLPPPDVANVRLSIASPLGVLVSWDAVDTLDVSHYVVSGDLSGRTSGTSLAIPPYNLTGTVRASVVAVDTLGLVSETPTQGGVTINGPARPAITSASLQTEGIAVSWRDAARTWPVARYIVTLGGVTVISQTATAIIPVPQSFAAGDAVTVQAVDIFNNAGEVSETVEVAITPPKTPEIKLALNAGDGTVTVVWQDCATVCPIRHYVISGAMSGTSTGTSASLPAPKAAGGVTVQVVAVDVYGIESGTGQATLSVTAPENPVIKAEVRTDGLYLAWQDCAASWPVRHYVITDPWAGETYTSLVTSQAVPPRPAGTYLFGVRAVDTVGLASSTIYASVELGGVGRAAPSVRVDGADLVISWPRVASSFPIDRYEIVTVQGEQIGSAKTTYYRFPCPAAGTHGYRVRAVDAAGNLGEWGEASIAVDRPEPPQVTAALDGAGITVRWAATGHQLPIVAWDLVRQWEEARDDGVIETHEEDYGRLDVDCLTVPAVSTGVHYFMVRAVDSAGNVSGWGDCDFTVVAPGKVAFVNCATVDNNVMLYWTAPDTVFFPIREYVFSEIDGDGYEMEIGRIDAQFASSFETVSGEYVYGVTPVDAGGNRGALSTIKMAVSQPPDFVFYHNKDSLFNGVKANFVLDGRGSMIGPVPDETWTENVARAGLLAGRAVESWQDKNAANYLTWLEPAFGLPLASYDGALWGRISYQDVGADGMTLFPDKERAWKHANADGTLFSQLWMLRDAGEPFRQADGTFEFLMFQSDATGPMGGNASVYARWKQTDNPATTYYGNVGTATDAVDGFEAVAKVGTSYPYGLAISSSSYALLDGQPKHSNWYGAVGLVSKYSTGAIPALTVQRYSQLWVRMPASLLAGGIGQYVETVDVGKLVPSTKITVTISSRTLSGNPAFACKIEVSQDNATWRTISDNATVVFATQFRYVRYTITATGGMAAISNINYSLDVKRKSDFGRVEVKTTDNGAGWTSESATPMLTGKWVPFNVGFVDVESLPKPNVVNDQNLTAFTVFEDVDSPKGFRIFVKDKNGNRAAGTVDWAAYGV